MSKAKSFAALKAEIAELELQAAAARQLEVKEAVASIKELIAKYGLTAAELGFKGANLVAAKSKTKSAQPRPGTGVPKYRDPKSGKTWTGAGKPPGWISAARNRDAFLIDATATDASGTQATKAPGNKPSVAPAKTAGGAKAKPRPAAATKPAAKAGAKPAVKAAASPKKAAPKAASKAAKPSKGKAGAGRTKIAVRKMEGSKKPRPAERSKVVGNGAAPVGDAGGGAPAVLAS